MVPDIQGDIDVSATNGCRARSDSRQAAAVDFELSCRPELRCLIPSLRAQKHHHQLFYMRRSPACHVSRLFHLGSMLIANSTNRGLAKFIQRHSGKFAILLARLSLAVVFVQLVALATSQMH